jgi:hypothetical protein
MHTEFSKKYSEGRENLEYLDLDCKIITALQEL